VAAGRRMSVTYCMFIHTLHSLFQYFPNSILAKCCFFVHILMIVAIICLVSIY